MYLLEELADAGLAGVVDYYYSFDHLFTGAAAALLLCWFGVSAVLGLPRSSWRFCGWVLGCRCGVPRVAARRVDGRTRFAGTAAC